MATRKKATRKKAASKKKVTTKKKAASKRTAPARKKPILSLTKLVEREFIEINGEPYDLKNLDELSLMEATRYEAMGKQLKDAATGTETDEELAAMLAESGELGRALDLAVRIVLVAPEEVYDFLDDFQRIAIMDVFTRLAGLTSSTEVEN